MKLEVGMYVRTDLGIYKINYFINNNYTQKFTYIDNIGVSNILEEKEVVKASHNIIDLIEENDLIQYRINGDLYVSEVKGHPLFNRYILHIEFGNTIIDLEDLQIISIVTKEQFESMSYKI